jgi:hypothetical protein
MTLKNALKGVQLAVLLFTLLNRFYDFKGRKVTFDLTVVYIYFLRTGYQLLFLFIKVQSLNNTKTVLTLPGNLVGGKKKFLKFGHTDPPPPPTDP